MRGSRIGGSRLGSALKIPKSSADANQTALCGLTVQLIGTIAGGTPAVPANHLSSSQSQLDGMLEMPVIEFCLVFKVDDAVFLVRVEDIFEFLEHGDEIRMTLIRCI